MLPEFYIGGFTDILCKLKLFFAIYSNSKKDIKNFQSETLIRIFF